MNEFWNRQLDYLKALTLAIVLFGVAGLLTWVTGGDIYKTVLGMAMFQACLATVRAGK